MQTGDEAEAVWEKLRGTRWNPPQAAAADPARRRTYVFALEQAEQMFRAAAGPAWRPGRCWLRGGYGRPAVWRAAAARAVRGVVLVRAGVDGLAVLVAQVGGQGAGAGSVQG